MKRYGIIGGTFDPIHYAHLYIAYEAYKQLNLDKVIFIPAGRQPLKAGKKVTKANLRYKMAKEAIEAFDEFIVSPYEINKEGLSFTYETLEYFKKYKIEGNIDKKEVIHVDNLEEFEDKQLFFITGADCLMSIEYWKEVSKIFNLCTLVVFYRSGFSKEEIIQQKMKIEKKYKANISVLDLKEMEISSTDIRNRILKKERVDFFVPPEIVKFIKENKLYIR